MAAEQLAQSYRREASLLLQSLGTLPCDDDDARGDFSGTSCSAADNESAKSSKLIHRQASRSSRSSSSSGGTVDLAEIGRRLVLRGSSVPATSPAQRRVAGADHQGSAIAAAAAAPLSPDFYCAKCGQIFAPCGTKSTPNGAGIGSSPSSIRLRTLSRGKTRRRRCSRVRARGCTRDERLSRDRGGGREWGSGGCGSGSGAGGGGQRGHCHAVAASVQIDHERRLIKSLNDVGDGTKHNCIVYTCGYCGARTKFGGLDVAARERRRNMGADKKKRTRQQGGIIDGAAKKIAGKGRADGRGMNKGSGPKSSPTLGSGETDFISLAPLPSSIAKSDDKDDTKERAPLPKEQHSFRATASESKKAVNAAAAAAASSSSPSVQRLDQLPSRKRKKKEKKKGKGGSNKKDGGGGGEGNRNKKSKLMDFLSTLNG